jgi:peptidoglycan/xylan/chitin deacetylase (PgdA/CDA1 family)
MNRREFATSLVLTGAAIAARPLEASSAAEAPELSITIDDFAVHPNPLLDGMGITGKILSSLDMHSGPKAVAFAVGRNVDNDQGRRILQAWNDAGHAIANHTYSHGNFHSRDISIDEFENDMLRCEEIIKGYPRFVRFFRFPMLHEGNTLEKRDGFRAFLKRRDYRIGHVTIDTSDWYIDIRLRDRLALLAKTGHASAAELAPYRDYYLAHLWDRAQFYNGLAGRVLKRRVRHTLLIHHTLLNALFLGDVLRMFESRGWKLIDAERAFEDPVFKNEPKTLPAGESLVWALAKETGRFEKSLRYPGEDGDYEKAKMDTLGL